MAVRIYYDQGNVIATLPDNVSIQIEYTFGSELGYPAEYFLYQIKEEGQISDDVWDYMIHDQIASLVRYDGGRDKNDWIAPSTCMDAHIQIQEWSLGPYPI